MGYRSTIQIVLVVISFVIIYTYINPTFKEMRETQAETAEYQEALESAASFNAELQRLLNTANSFSTTERRALERYLPNSIDTIAVMRDIETIVSNNDMVLSGLSSGSTGSGNTARVNAVQDSGDGVQKRGRDVFAQQFTLGVTGSYDQFKVLLQDLERNAYPLEVADITFTPDTSSLYTFNITLETYALNSSIE